MSNLDLMDMLHDRIRRIERQNERIETHLMRQIEFMEGQTIGVREVARHLGVSTETVRIKCRHGELPFVPGSRPYRFIRSEIINHQKKGMGA